MAEAMAVEGVRIQTTARGARGLGRDHLKVNCGRDWPKGGRQLGRWLGRGAQGGIGLVRLQTTGLSKLLTKFSVFPLQDFELGQHGGVLLQHCRILAPELGHLSHKLIQPITTTGGGAPRTS